MLSNKTTHKHTNWNTQTGGMNSRSCCPEDHRMRREAAASSLSLLVKVKPHVRSPLQDIWPLEKVLEEHKEPAARLLELLEGGTTAASQTGREKDNRKLCSSSLWWWDVQWHFTPQLSFIKAICMKTNERVVKICACFVCFCTFLGNFPFFSDCMCLFLLTLRSTVCSWG